MLERKFLSYSQNRLGPQKISYYGILQPLLDGVKLILKPFYFINKINNVFFFTVPVVFFLFLNFLWFYFPLFFTNFKFLFLFYIVIIGLRVFFIFFIGWSSNSKFSYLSSIRGLSQSISFEVSLNILFCSIFYFYFRLNFYFLKDINFKIFFFFPLLILLTLRIIAEINRIPFDFSERERELVSGFNVEYRSLGFILIFLTEYGFIIFFSFLLRFLFFKALMFFFLFFLLLIRRTFPRFRYDKLIYINWFKILPLRILLLIFYF